MTYQLEKMVQMINPKVAVPYWDFLKDASEYGSDWHSSPLWGDDWFGTLNTSPDDNFRVCERCSVGVPSPPRLLTICVCQVTKGVMADLPSVKKTKDKYSVIDIEKYDPATNGTTWRLRRTGRMGLTLFPLRFRHHYSPV
jgi:hypothetical protein